MASPAAILAQNDKNLKWIRKVIDGKTHLQRDIMNFIEKHNREEEERWKAHADGTPLPSRGEELVAKRSEAQKKRKEKDPMMK